MAHLPWLSFLTLSLFRCAKARFSSSMGANPAPRDPRAALCASKCFRSGRGKSSKTPVFLFVSGSAMTTLSVSLSRFRSVFQGQGVHELRFRFPLGRGSNGSLGIVHLKSGDSDGRHRSPQKHPGQAPRLLLTKTTMKRLVYDLRGKSIAWMHALIEFHEFMHSEEFTVILPQTSPIALPSFMISHDDAL